MNINEIIRNIIENATTPDGKKMTQAAIIDHINRKYGQSVTAAALSDRLKNKNMKINTVIEMLDLLDYEVVIRSKKEGLQSYVVERGTGRD